MAETKTAPAQEQKETRADAFKRLANARVSKALQAIEVIGNLSSANYEKTPEQVAKIMGALQAELDTLEAKFEKPDAVQKSGFSL